MTTCNELYCINEPTVSTLFRDLSKEERIFVLLMSRAMLPFNRIFRDQNHCCNNEIIELFESLYRCRSSLDPELVSDIETYLVYLWTNHGIYFHAEDSDAKRTPARLGLTHLTPENLSVALEKVGIKCSERLFPVIFEKTVDPEMTINGNIEKSGNNYYGRGFTEEHYLSFPADVRNSINAYFSLDTQGSPRVEYYSTTGKYGPELTVAVCWMKRALRHVQQYPNTFDVHFVKSLDLLIQFFESGKEELFKQHCIEWLQTCSHLDYTFGFIETYKDPKGIRGQAGGEVTIKTVDMKRVNPVLLAIEQKLPHPLEYMRSEDGKTTLNVSLNKIAFASGDYGPCKLYAVCLPNYEDIRSQHGSKQIIYKSSESLEELLNPDLVKQFRSTARQAFVDKYDPDNQILDDLWDLQVLLHETIGHASGKLHQHVFTETTEFQGKTYEPGDIIEVTDTNLTELLKSDQSSLEELRAEINALYMSVAETDTLSKEGLCKDWIGRIGKVEFQKQCIIEMTLHAFRRLRTQKDNMDDIRGSHARANTVITNYLLESGGIRIIDEIKSVNGKEFHLLDIEVVDFEKALTAITSLCRLVQRIKSTGDGKGCQQLFGKYTKYPVTIEQARIYRQYGIEKRLCVTGNVKMIARIFPNYRPVLRDVKDPSRTLLYPQVLKDDEIVDVIEDTPQTIVEQHLEYSKKMLSTSW